MSRARRLKYGNRPVALGDLKFSSKAEARRYGELLLLQRLGTISSLVCQPRFPLIVNGIKIGTYVGDFAYMEGNIQVIEDVKSPATKTATYKLKKALMKALYHKEIKEIVYP